MYLHQKHLMLWSRLESLDHVYYLIVFLSSCNAVLWIIVGTRFVGFLAHNHNEMKWMLNSFSTDLYPPAFSRDIYETFLVFEQHEFWWYRRCIEKKINATRMQLMKFTQLCYIYYILIVKSVSITWFRIEAQ